MPNVYDNPGSFKLTIVGTASNDELWYEFDMFVVWRDAEGNFLWAFDSGCSCTAPFADLTLDDLGKGTSAQAMAALFEWAGSDPDKQAPGADLAFKLASL